MNKITKEEVSKLVEIFVNAGNELAHMWDLDEDVREALNNTSYPDGVPSFDEMMNDFTDWKDEYRRLIELKEKDEEILMVNYSWIKYNIGWSSFAEQTNRNVYANKEFPFDDKEQFSITKKQAREIGYIK